MFALQAISPFAEEEGRVATLLSLTLGMSSAPWQREGADRMMGTPSQSPHLMENLSQNNLTHDHMGFLQTRP